MYVRAIQSARLFYFLLLLFLNIICALLNPWTIFKREKET